MFFTSYNKPAIKNYFWRFRMYKRVGVFFTFLLLSVALFAEPYDNRNDPVKAKDAYQYYKAEFAKNPTSYAAAWKSARMTYFYATFIVDQKNTELLKKLYTEGKDAAEKATRLNSKGVEGWYWFGTCLGSWAEKNGIMASLGSAGKVLNAAKKACQINQAWENASPLALRGRFYQNAPGFIGGSIEQSEKDYKKGIELAPKSRVLYRFYAELLISKKENKKAADIIEKGLAFDTDPANKLKEESEIKHLKALKKEL